MSLRRLLSSNTSTGLSIVEEIQALPKQLSREYSYREGLQGRGQEGCLLRYWLFVGDILWYRDVCAATLEVRDMVEPTH